MGSAGVQRWKTCAGDPARRAAVERRALRPARDLVTAPGGFRGVADLTRAARRT
ncbi:hypothetical protein ACMATS_02305 [Streptoverticillium reticulum]|uniref:hypothetical protein n=1 Tax=Streptoverticillium reticulum TaxID=1433415 RepID=UPI0039BFB88A